MNFRSSFNRSPILAQTTQCIRHATTLNWLLFDNDPLNSFDSTYTPWPLDGKHFSGAILGPMSSWRHERETFSVSLALCEGNPPVTGGFPHKGQWRRALMFSLICASTNGWSNNGDTGDLRHHRAHYDVAVMVPLITVNWPMFSWGIYTFFVRGQSVYHWCLVGCQNILSSNTGPMSLS